METGTAPKAGRGKIVNRPDCLRRPAESVAGYSKTLGWLKVRRAVGVRARDNPVRAIDTGVTDGAARALRDRQVSEFLVRCQGQGLLRPRGSLVCLCEVGEMR